MDKHERRCRFCGELLTDVFVDLGSSPLANAYLTEEQCSQGEMAYPLKVFVCKHCKLVQLEEFESPNNIFSDYAYFSSYSQSWLEHARRYTEQMIAEQQLTPADFVVEIASNDGYLLQNFVEKGYRVLGVEPAQNIAAIANAQGIPTTSEFFGIPTARELAAVHGKAKLLIGNNVLAHVPDINDFVGGMKILLAAEGFITMEFPHLLQLMQKKQFDTIYHEHFSYLSLLAVQAIFERHGLTVFRVEELPTHGGSLRIYASHQENDFFQSDGSAERILQKEYAAGLHQLETYGAFHKQVQASKREILKTLIQLKEAGHTIAGYGAPAKGNTMLNYCGIGLDFLDFTVDRNPDKQGKYLPGSHIPIYAVSEVEKRKPEYLLLLPWNLKEEIMAQMQIIRSWNGQFVTLIPEISIE